MSGILSTLTASGLSMKARAAPNPTEGTGVQTGFASVTLENARFPVTYLWQFQGGDGLDATNPTSPSTRFAGGPPPSGEVYVASFNCTATDANGRTATSNTIVARLTGI